MRSLVLITSAALVLLLVACGSNNAAKSGGQNMRGMATNAPAAPPAVALSTGAAASPIAGAQTVNITLTEYAVTLDTTAVHPGPLHLIVRNAGQRGHQLQLYPALAMSAQQHDQAMQMNGSLMAGAVGYLQLIPSGETTVLDVTVSAGSWEIACHLQDAENGQAFDHYDKGMKSVLTVRA